MKKKSAPMGVIVVILLAAWMFKTHQPAAPRADSPESGRPVAVSFQDGTPAPTVSPRPPASENRSAAHEQPERERRERQQGGHAGAHESAPYQVTGVRIVDIHTGRTMNIASVDLRPTLRRIEAGEKNAHRNDGTVFRNSAHKLPRKPAGYYHEYVVPTEGLRGPGPQRLVIGREGEMYYTFDHYETFIELKGER